MLDEMKFTQSDYCVETMNWLLDNRGDFTLTGSTLINESGIWQNAVYKAEDEDWVVNETQVPEGIMDEIHSVWEESEMSQEDYQNCVVDEDEKPRFYSVKFGVKHSLGPKPSIIQTRGAGAHWYNFLIMEGHEYNAWIDATFMFNKLFEENRALFADVTDKSWRRGFFSAIFLQYYLSVVK